VHRTAEHTFPALQSEGGFLEHYIGEENVVTNRRELRATVAIKEMIGRVLKRLARRCIGALRMRIF
jgi:hypothetical protein